MPNSAGFPLFRHCSLFPDETTLDEAGNLVVEASRVSIGRHYTRRRDDPPFGAVRGVGNRCCRRGRRDSRPPQTPVGTVSARFFKATIYGAKGRGRDALCSFATDAAFHRWLVHFGLPLRLAGPEADYYGRVAPHIMSMSELDQVVLSGRLSRAR